MDEWENNSPEKSPKEQRVCRCSAMNGLFVPNRHLSFVVAGLMLMVFSTFMTGYFWGKKYSVEQFTQKVHQDSFADEVYASVFSLAQPEVSNKTAAAISPEPVQSVPDLSNQEQVANNQKQVSDEDQNAKTSSSASYYAQLIGFGTSQAAGRFVRRLEKKGIAVQSKKRASKTKKGRTIYWYQVVTPPYTDKAELEMFVAKLSKEEKLNGVQIVTC